jgi:hypothetical protein
LSGSQVHTHVLAVDVRVRVDVRPREGRRRRRQPPVLGQVDRVEGTAGRRARVVVEHEPVRVVDEAPAVQDLRGLRVDHTLVAVRAGPDHGLECEPRAVDGPEVDLRRRVGLQRPGVRQAGIRARFGDRLAGSDRRRGGHRGDVREGRADEVDHPAVLRDVHLQPVVEHRDAVDLLHVRQVVRAVDRDVVIRKRERLEALAREPEGGRVLRHEVERDARCGGVARPRQEAVGAAGIANGAGERIEGDKALDSERILEVRSRGRRIVVERGRPPVQLDLRRRRLPTVEERLLVAGDVVAALALLRRIPRRGERAGENEQRRCCGEQERQAQPVSRELHILPLRWIPVTARSVRWRDSLGSSIGESISF